MPSIPWNLRDTQSAKRLKRNKTVLKPDLPPVSRYMGWTVGLAVLNWASMPIDMHES